MVAPLGCHTLINVLYLVNSQCMSYHAGCLKCLYSCQDSCGNPGVGRAFAVQPGVPYVVTRFVVTTIKESIIAFFRVLLEVNE